MIVITGGAGLIGGAVVRELNRRGYDDLILVDHLGMSDKWKNLRSLKYRLYFEREQFIDLVEQSLQLGLDSEFRGIKAIIHLGANSSTMEKDATHLVDNNYWYSVKLARFARKFDIRMVYASSAATYGDGELGFDDDIDKLDELRPLNMYGYSKQMFDQWLAREGFYPYFAGLKYFNVFGPNEYHKGDMMSLVLKAYRQIMNEGKIRLFRSHRDDYRDGEQMRDFFYVEDAAKMTVFLVLDNPNACGLFNAGSGVASTWLELAGAIFSAMDRETNIEFIDIPENIRDRYQYYTCAPIDRIRKEGFSDSITPLADAVKDYVQNYLMKGEKII